MTAEAAAHLEEAGVAVKPYAALLGDVRALAAGGTRIWADPAKACPGRHQCRRDLRTWCIRDLRRPARFRCHCLRQASSALPFSTGSAPRTSDNGSPSRLQHSKTFLHTLQDRAPHSKRVSDFKSNVPAILQGAGKAELNGMHVLVLLRLLYLTSAALQVSYAIHQAACEALAEAQEPASARGKRSATPRKRPRRDGAKPEASAAEPEPGDPAHACLPPNSASDIRSCTVRHCS